MLILLIGLIIIMIISYIIFKRDIICPAVLFNFGFASATFCAYLYEKDWGFYEKQFYTLVFFSCIAFVAGCFSAYFFAMLDKKRNKLFVKDVIEIKHIDIRNINLIIYVIIEIFFIFINIYEINVNVHTGSNITEKIGLYYELRRRGMLDYQVPLLNIFRILNTSVMYYIIYTILVDKVLKRTINRFSIILVFLGFILAYLTGTRTEIFMYCISGFIIYIILLRYIGKIIKINFKYILMLLGMLILFNIFAVIQGRVVENMTAGEVFVTYLGAPLKNLEIFISNSVMYNANLFGEATFSNLYQWLSISSNQVEGLYQYRFIHGKGLGNVATLLAPIYHDFGMHGSMVMLFIIGVISQLIYNNILLKKNKNVQNNILIYSFVAFAVTFSFFSNKFFELVVARAMIYFIVSIYISQFYFSKIKLRIKDKK